MRAPIDSLRAPIESLREPIDSLREPIESSLLADRAWSRLGFEVELLTPPGASRLTFAEELADRFGGSIRTVFHHDTEPSLVKGRPIFHHLTTAVDVVSRHGAMICRMVDDVTILADLDRDAEPTPGWYRILSDEPRLLRLVEQLADPTAPIDQVLDPVAEAFGVKVERLDGDTFRLDDTSGATVAIAAPQGGQRERVCEVITPPISADHERTLDTILSPARELGLAIPAEAAVHVHLDAAPFRSAVMLRALVKLFADDRDELWAALGTNRRCRRLGPLPDELVAGVAAPGFTDKPWAEIARWLATLPLSKFSDCNLVKLARPGNPVDTVELRTLPGAIGGGAIMAGVETLKRGFLQRL